MKLLDTIGWDDYALLDSGNGKRLERFGRYTLVRPDPQCIWKQSLPDQAWEEADAVFGRGKNGKEQWGRKTNVPHEWLLQYNALSFYAKLSPFKHTGVFPEQQVMWDWLTPVILSVSGGSRHRDSSPSVQNDKKRRPNVLNLFGYTGIASLVCAAAGAKVTHVDASYPTIGWARQNQIASGLSEKPIRWILDDCLKFVQREVKRGVTYDGIIMDPPVFGHGPKGERWEFFENFPQLLSLSQKILTDKPLFFIINAYAISASSIMLENVLMDAMKSYGGTVDSGELVLREKDRNRSLSTGIYARWSRE